MHSDQRNFERAYTAAMDAMRSPHCTPEPQCEHQVLKAAMVQAYRAEKPALARKALAAWAPRPTRYGEKKRRSVNVDSPLLLMTHP